MKKSIMKRISMFFVAVLMACMSYAQDNTLVTPPEDAAVELWAIAYDEYDQSDNLSHVSETAKVVTVGSDMYISGLAINGAWVKGSLNDGKLVIPKMQYVGSAYTYSFYLAGYIGTDEPVDIEFAYDAEKEELSSTTDIVLTTTNGNVFGHTTNIIISKNGIVTPSDGKWTLTGQNVNPANDSQYWTLNEEVNVTIEGNSITVYGLGVEESAALQGTISGNTATFAKGQSAGTYSGTQLFFIGYAGEGAIDIVFDYDDEKGVLTAQSWILAVDADSNTYLLLKNIVISKGGATPVIPEDDVVEAPSGISLSDYLFKATSISYDSEGGVAGMEPVQYNVRVGFQGKDVYIQGLFEGMPLAWVKGTKNSDGDYVFQTGQYYGHHPQIESQRFYFCGQIFGGMSDVEMSYDQSSRVFSGGSYYILVNSDKSVLAPYYVFAGVTISKISEKAAVPANPSVVQYAAYNDEYGYGFVCFDVPATDKDGNPIVRDKLNYKMYVQKDGQQDAYVFTPQLYKNLTSDMSLVPYFFSDGYDFMLGGSQVCFYEESIEWEKVGVQSVYSGGYVNNTSDICWYDIKGGQTDIQDNEELRIKNEKLSVVYDLQGRKVDNSKSTHGIFIVNGKKVVR